MTRPPAPPWDFLENCSRPSLENFMLLRQNVAAMMRKSIAADIEEWAIAAADAHIAYLLLNEGKELARIADLRQTVLSFPNPEVTTEKTAEIDVRDRVLRNQRAEGYAYRRPTERSA